MSIEQIVLLILFLVLPLIQFLVRVARQRGGQEAERREGQPSPGRQPAMQEPQPPTHAPLPPAPAGPPVPATERHRLSHAMAVREPAPMQDAAPTVARRPAARRSAQRRAAVMDLRNPLNVRRAIVLMTILGQCRATDPYEWPERGGSR